MSYDLIQRLKAHIQQMAPHQKQREAGKLLIEAATELERLNPTKDVLCRLVYNHKDGSVVITKP